MWAHDPVGELKPSIFEVPFRQFRSYNGGRSLLPRVGMDLQPKRSPDSEPPPRDFADPPVKQPLVWLQTAQQQPLVVLQQTERSLRRKTVETVTPFLPEAVAINLGEASLVAEESLEQLATIDLDTITDAELQPARIQVGLIFVGFGALLLVFLLLYVSTMHPDLSLNAQIRLFWFQYIGCMALGATGLFMLGREAMRL